MTLVQSRSRNTELENMCMDTEQGEGEKGTGDWRPTRVLSTGSTELMTNESLPCGKVSFPQCLVGI